MKGHISEKSSCNINKLYAESSIQRTDIKFPFELFYLILGR